MKNNFTKFDDFSQMWTLILTLYEIQQRRTKVGNQSKNINALSNDLSEQSETTDEREILTDDAIKSILLDIDMRVRRIECSAKVIRI